MAICGSRSPTMFLWGSRTSSWSRATPVHLEEIDVHPDHSRRGVGTRLVLHVCEWAAGQEYQLVTLTTFRDVAWNMPWYARLGFAVVPPERLSTGLRTRGR